MAANAPIRRNRGYKYKPWLIAGMAIRLHGA
jgi:hypothetical protein